MTRLALNSNDAREIAAPDPMFQESRTTPRALDAAAIQITEHRK